VPGSARSFFSRISVRVLAFNVLIVFIPITGVLSLGTYEKQLLDALERSLVQQGRVFAASLENSGPSLRAEAEQTLQRLRQRREARIRIVDAHGTLLADSSTLGRIAETATASVIPSAEAGRATDDSDAAQYGIVSEEGALAPAADEPAMKTAQETFLYRLASFPVRMWRRYLRPPQPPTESSEYYSVARVLDGAEITDALAGRYGAVTRITAGQQSVTLYSAIPVLDRGTVVGAVLVSQSTFRILSDLYVLRLDIFRLFLWSVVTAVVLSLLVSATISVPLGRLRDQAREILDPRGRLVGKISPSHSRDEVGELSRSLGELTTRMQRYMRGMESFASDVSHEFKNPLASIRSAAELALASGDPEERRVMLTMVLEDVRRLERLLSGVREISRIDSVAAEQGPKTPADAREIAGRIAEATRRRLGGGGVTLSVEGGDGRVRVPPERLEQVLENLVDNAVSFSPPGGEVRVSVERAGGMVVIRVCDDGPGIPEGHRERIFDRFFSFRPGEEKGVHAGLGLAIVKAIAESHGGGVRADNRPGGGACFEVSFPAG
jgi:two-component system, OmpR family, sensor histidine kinase ChvG